MKNWNKTALYFSIFLAAIVCIVLMYTDKDKTWIQYAVTGIAVFLASYLVLYMLSLLFEEKNETIDTNGIKDGDVFYNYNDYNFGYSRVERVEVLDAVNQQLRSSFAFADKTGEIKTKWYQVATDFIEPGVAAVAEDVKGTLMWNFIDENCETLSATWFYKIADNYSDDKIKVYWNDGTINFLDFKEKKLLWSDWKKSVN